MRGGFRIDLPGRASHGYTSPGDDAATLVFDHQTMTIWSDEPVVSLGDFGCIIGHLFTQDIPSHRVHHLSRASLNRILVSGGRSLLADYWGGYLLALVTPDDGVTIMRDPSGLLPCYLRCENRAVTLADDICELAAPGAERVNLEEVARYLASSDASGHATCVADVEELLAGECLRFSQSRTRTESWWSPWDFVEPSAHRSFRETAAELRTVVTNCIGSWADCFDNVLLGVSGGLDSSTVAAGSVQRSNLTCLTLVGPDIDGDERRYARRLTDAIGLPLIDAPYDLADVDIAKPVAPHHPWPNASYFRQAIGAIHRRIEDSVPIDAHFSGNGGDGIFCSLRSAVPFIDRFIAEGPRTALAVTLRDLCELTDVDAATVLKHAWRKYRRLGDHFTPSYNPLGLRADTLVRVRSDSSRHPWLEVPVDSLPGKAAHVAFLRRAQRSLELYPRRSAPPHVAPLLSQPVIELCLSIPTWFWIDGGRDRAVARAAFEGVLPEILLRRTHKGGPSGFSRVIYDRWGGEIRHRLRQGRLAEADILDPEILEEIDDPSGRDVERWRRILALGVAESWVQWWSGG